MPRPEGAVVGWDIGGAHVKASWLQHGALVDVAQWACPLWQGLEQLQRVLGLAAVRWPALHDAVHVVTMTGEMVDLFEHREDGVRRIAALLAGSLPGVQFFAGDTGWCGASDVHSHWDAIASANWLATARHAADHCGRGVLVDIGSTTTDLIAFDAGRVSTASRSDADRLGSGELVYHGVVRTPLCAFSARIGWRGAQLNVMNEFFATAADVYRLTGELDPAHDLHPSADNAPKDLPATRQRLARMIGRDARDASEDEWLDVAHAWRQAQVVEIGGQLARVLDALDRDDPGTVVSAGCGAFLVGDVVAAARPGRRVPVVPYGARIARLSDRTVGDADALRAAAQVCAPCVAVATLFAREQR